MELLLRGLLVLMGVFLVGVALFVEARHEHIWRRYKKQFRRPDSELMHQLTRPHDLVYKFNVYILWPLLFLLGIGAFVAAFWV